VFDDQQTTPSARLSFFLQGKRGKEVADQTQPYEKCRKNDRTCREIAHGEKLPWQEMDWVPIVALQTWVEE
jgi:hypothetical protein